MQIVDEYSWNTSFQQRLKKKKLLQAGLDQIIRINRANSFFFFFFEVENISVVIHICKKCAKMSVFM